MINLGVKSMHINNFNIGTFVDSLSKHEKDTVDPEESIVNLLEDKQSLKNFLDSEESVSCRVSIGERS